MFAKLQQDKGYNQYAAAAKSLQSCLTLCDPIDGSPPGSPVPGILQAETLEWVAISFSNACKWKVKVKLLSRVWLLATPWTAASQAPPSMGFSRQEYCSWEGSIPQRANISLPWGKKCLLQGHHSQTLTLFGAGSSQQQVVLVVKNLPVNAGDVRVEGSIPGLGRSPEEGDLTKSRTPFPRASIQTVSTHYPSYIPGCSVHGIFQARVLEWSAIAFSLF